MVEVDDEVEVEDEEDQVLLTHVKTCQLTLQQTTRQHLNLIQITLIAQIQLPYVHSNVTLDTLEMLHLVNVK